MPGIRSQTLGFGCFSFALILTVSGCGEAGDGLPRQAVSGTVMFDGQLLASGTIRFSPVSGSGTEGGSLIREGQFSIPREQGLVPGNYKVSVYSGNTTGERPKAEMGPGRAPKIAKEMIPSKYNSMTKEEVEIKGGGSNVLTFKLEK